MLFIRWDVGIQLLDGLLDLEQKHLGQLGLHGRSEVVLLSESSGNAFRSINIVTSEDLNALLKRRGDVDIDLEQRDPLA